MTTTIIILALALLCAVATANHYRRRWARAEDTNRFLVEQCNQLNERIERMTADAHRRVEKWYIHSSAN